MIKLVFWGTPQFAVPSLERLIKDPAFEVLGVVTQPDRRRGRGKQLVPSAIKVTTQKYGLPVWQPQFVKKDPETLAWLRSQQADAFVVVAYGQILSPEILKMPQLGCINSHGSLLPTYRGAAPIQWALHDGQKQTGITTMLMDAGMDTGDMLLTTTVNIDPLENAQDLSNRLAHQSGDLLVETLIQLEEKTLHPVPQDENEATYARLIQKEDYHLDWRNTAISLHNQVRGFFPFCTASYQDQPLKIMVTLPLISELITPSSPWSSLVHSPGSKIGSIVHIAKNEGPIVQTGEGFLLLKELQLSGKKRQSGWDFANGLRLSVGDVLQNG